MICLKHSRWIGNRVTEQRQIDDRELRNVERRFRRIMAELVQIVLDVIASRTDPFAGDGREPEAGRWRVL